MLECDRYPEIREFWHLFSGLIIERELALLCQH